MPRRKAISWNKTSINQVSSPHEKLQTTRDIIIFLSRLPNDLSVDSSATWLHPNLPGCWIFGLYIAGQQPTKVKILSLIPITQILTIIRNWVFLQKQVFSELLEGSRGEPDCAGRSAPSHVLHELTSDVELNFPLVLWWKTGLVSSLGSPSTSWR